LLSLPRGWVAIMLEPQIAKAHQSVSIRLMFVGTQLIIPIITVSTSRINAMTEPAVIIHD